MGESHFLTERRAVSPSDPKTSLSAPLPSAQKETRATPRRRVLKSGIIAFNDRYSALPCTVRNLSTTGAHLRAEGTINVPNTFELLIELDGFEVNCEVLWRKDKETGVRFLSAPRMVTPKRSQVVNALGPVHPPTLRRKPLS
jgi:PilZ domain-containing protein